MDKLYNRSFFAILIDEAGRFCIDKLKKTLGLEKVHWQPEEKLHLTLHFLGKLPTELLSSLMTEVRETVHDIAPFQVACEQLRYKHGVLVLETRPIEALEILVSQIRAGVKAAGLPVTDRPFWGHITLGRMRKTLEPLKTDLKFSVNEIVLLNSETLPQGSVYLPLGKIPLLKG